jgi:maleate cis-trans isomerase
MRGAAVAEPLERELDIPVYDSISVTVWKSLQLGGIDAARVRGWGSVFAQAGQGKAALGERRPALPTGGTP